MTFVECKGSREVKLGHQTFNADVANKNYKAF